MLFSGCTASTKVKVQDGGIFKSVNQGNTWEQKVYIETVKKKVVDISKVDVGFIKFDPHDSRILYAGTSQGLYRTENSADQWQLIFGAAGISDLAMDLESRSIIYATLGNQIFKTADSAISWQPIYLESRPNIFMTQIAVDSADQSLIYAGNSSGDLIESRDYGSSWNTVYNFGGSAVTKILVNPGNHNIVYVATSANGIWKTINRGQSWENLLNNYSIAFPGSASYHWLDFYQGKGDSLLYASNYGILTSFDGGKTWQARELLTPPNTVNIKSIAQNPINSQIIYYATDTALYRTEDGGLNWQTQHLPTSRAASVLLIDFYNPDIIYLGTVKVKK